MNPSFREALFHAVSSEVFPLTWLTDAGMVFSKEALA
jgi:hypothetical protein